MNGELKRVLIAVKTYPNPSRKYTETVCVAGIDLHTGEWVRLYPITYRDLDRSKKFKKYQIIEVRAAKAVDDKHPESYKVDRDSIRLLDCLDTNKDRTWSRRKVIVLPTVDKSMCEILRKMETEDKSLGMFKPRNVGFVIAKAKPKDQKARDSCYAQLTFFDKHKKTIEKIPFDFRYKFFCCNHNSKSCSISLARASLESSNLVFVLLNRILFFHFDKLSCPGLRGFYIGYIFSNLVGLFILGKIRFHIPTFSF